MQCLEGITLYHAITGPMVSIFYSQFFPSVTGLAVFCLRPGPYYKTGGETYVGTPPPPSGHHGSSNPWQYHHCATAHCPPNQKKIICHSLWTLDRPPLTPYIMQYHHYGNAHCPLSTYSKEATMDIGQTTTNTIYNAIPPIKRSHYGKAGSSHKLLIKRERLFSNTQLYSAFLEDHILHIRNIYKTFALGTKETSRDLVNVGI